MIEIKTPLWQIKLASGAVYNVTGKAQGYLADLLTGIVLPPEGNVKINGFDVATQPRQAKRQVADVRADVIYPDVWTVKDVLSLSVGSDNGDTAIALREVLEKSDLTDVAGTAFANLTSSEKEKLAAAPLYFPTPTVFVVRGSTFSEDGRRLLASLLETPNENATLFLLGDLACEGQTLSADETLSLAETPESEATL